jgi:hypothetical protein
LKIHYIKNCGDVANAVIKVQENSSLVVTDDCTVIPNACGKETFSTNFKASTEFRQSKVRLKDSPQQG